MIQGGWIRKSRDAVPDGEVLNLEDEYGISVFIVSIEFAVQS